MLSCRTAFVRVGLCRVMCPSQIFVGQVRLGLLDMGLWVGLGQENWTYVYISGGLHGTCQLVLFVYNKYAVTSR